MYFTCENPIDNFKIGLNCGTKIYFCYSTELYDDYFYRDYCRFKYIRIAIIPNDAKITECYCMLTSDKIILSDKYYLYDVKTIKRFNLKITCNYITEVCYLGIIDTLEYLKKSNNIINYNESALNFASKNGQVEVLEWWKKSGLELKYTEDALNDASWEGHVEVLEWWKNSGLELKYTEDALYLASSRGHINVLEWWKNSGLELKWVLDYAFDNFNIEVLEWWKNSGFELDGVLKYCAIGLIWYKRMSNYKIAMLKYLRKLRFKIF
jgi:hypothetical protein